MASSAETSGILQVLKCLEAHDLSISHFLHSLLTDLSLPRHATLKFLNDLRSNASRLISTLVQQTKDKELHNDIFNITSLHLQAEVKDLILHGDELQFGASSAKAQQLESFQLDHMARYIAGTSPHLWSLLDTLLSATQKQSSTYSSALRPSEIEEEDDEYWDEIDDLDLEGIIDFISGDEPTRKRRLANRRRAILTIKKVVIVSIVMQSTNRKTNAFASIIGIFLHSCKTPEKVVEALARLGISISITSIHSAITSLSNESANRIRALGQSMLMNYAYDNFDVNLKTSQPTVEKSATTLRHLTSGLMFPLQHGVTLEDMKCSEYLWKHCPLNIYASPSDLPPTRSWKDVIDRLRDVHPEPNISTRDGLSRRERFNSWKFLRDLIDYGPEYFAQFRSRVKPPEIVESIDLIKTEITPVRSMEFSNSTVSGNISTIRDLMEQAGIGDPEDPEIDYEVTDATEYAILFHGDLGTGDRILSLQTRRSAEATPWRRFQYAIFVPGLFHLKMACADAIYRIFLQPILARDDPTSLMGDIGKLRPRETGIYGSNPGYRRMHQLILHSGICRRLNCWIEEICRINKDHKTLEDFAASKPSLEQLQKMADAIAQRYVSTYQMSRIRRQPKDQRDQQHENALILNKYLLLYEELAFAMNEGDIGRVETVLIPWIFIFRASGKHKYAHHMIQYLANVHFNYPTGLSKAIRHHILVNPTGKPGKFRGVDWCVELNNLYTKDQYGGESSNYTVPRIIKESSLVQLYRKAKNIMESNLTLGHLTTAHGDPDMTKTFQELISHISKVHPYKFERGRDTSYIIPDQIDKGRGMMMTTEGMDIDNDEDSSGDGGTAVGLDDVIIDMIM